MIAVERPPAPAAVLAAFAKRAQATGLTEIEEALWYYAGIAPNIAPLPNKPAEAPEFKAYSDDAVKAELHALFGGHCAYCESRYDHVSPMDVEHYRPKGAVIEANGQLSKPGYFWLASDWDNLLPSCIGCNRARKQEQLMPDGSVIAATSGKGNHFPLQAGSVRATAPGQEVQEQPLLLDPCRTDPEPHLLFRSDGFVEPRTSAQEQAMPLGITTILVCGLVRVSLVESRRRASTRLRNAMEAILSADHDCRHHPGDGFYITRRQRVEAALAQLIGDLDYRALTAELCSLFDLVRSRINAYYAAEVTWRVDKAEANRTAVVEATRAILKQYASAGLHQHFVHELLRLADIPLDQMLAA
jgi:uncharacterized protein (TIGR02646 family)